jgi:hypothetical protein
VLALALTLMTAGSALAARRSTVSTDNWGTIGIWGTYTNFSAIWDAVQMTNSSGGKYWQINPMQMSATVSNGKACNDVICGDWAFSVRAEFLNSSGTVLSQLTTSSMPLRSCYSAAYATSSRYFVRCKNTSTTVSGSANRIRFTWTVSVQRAQDGLWLNAWGNTKTVPIY